MFAALEHEEEGAKDFMGDGDDSAFVPAANDTGVIRQKMTKILTRQT
ncbi:MAG: hypothetical protein LBQ62_05570 [Candidatus Accumulibacter sp.]|jgi:hypothetical protein|nr:hypothetical protein [Accumulibacter sp.]